jgi:gluconolactonase
MKRLCLPVSAALLLLLPAALVAQGAEAITRLDPALDSLVDLKARVEKLAGGLGFLEGPLWMPEGYLLFSDLVSNTVMKYTPGGKVEPFLPKAGYDPDEPTGGRHVGPNGLVLDRQGRLVICQQGNRQVIRIEKDGSRTLLAKDFEGKHLNSPNDIVRARDGSLYFTDPPYGIPKGEKAELSFNGIYRIRDGKLELVTNEVARPNGLAFSPGEKYLYLVDGPLIKRFDMQRDGSITNGTVIFDMAKVAQRGGPDGFKVDRRGNLFSSGPGGIIVISPEGKHLGTIRVPENPANCAFGGKDGRTLFITARTGLYSVQLKTSGSRQ